MKNRKYSRKKKDKSYLRKLLYYLKNFLHAYRAHLTRYRYNITTIHSLHKSIQWWRCCYQDIVHCRRQFHVTCTKFYQSFNGKRRTEVVYYYYDFRLSMTSFITSPGFCFIELSRPSRIDKFYFCFDLQRSVVSVLMRKFHINREMDEITSSRQPTKLFRSAGQMLINWFMQSLQSTSSTLTTNLNENDQSVLAYQFCNNLLTVGVIRKLDETATDPTFKVCIMRFNFQFISDE